jgi:hypothetical protein
VLGKNRRINSCLVIEDLASIIINTTRVLIIYNTRLGAVVEVLKEAILYMRRIVLIYSRVRINKVGCAVIIVGPRSVSVSNIN